MNGATWVECEDGSLLNLAHFAALRVVPVQPPVRTNGHQEFELQAVMAADARMYVTIAHGGERSLRALRDLIAAALESEFGWRVIRVRELLVKEPRPAAPVSEPDGGRSGD